MKNYQIGISVTSAKANYYITRMLDREEQYTEQQQQQNCREKKVEGE